MDYTDWRDILRASFKSEKDLGSFELSDREEAFFSYRGPEDKLRFLVNPYYASLAGSDPQDPIRRQFMPRIEEYTVRDCELTDPLGESEYTPVPRLVHRYRDRALLLVTDACAMYCRHCFRRSFAGHDSGVLTDDQLKEAAAYLDKHREVNELLLSGGDPLTCSDEKLEEILKIIRSKRPDLAIRLATRMPVVLPQRITESLADMLSRYAPLWVVTQFNHNREINEESSAATDRLINRGIPILNQAVLLKGINDNVSDLEKLFQSLVRMRIKPYYLFQGDLAAGTSHFRVSLERGREIMAELRTRISGLALPVYAVDLPGGGGKIPLTENYETGRDEDNYYFRNIEGREYAYPRER